MKRFYEIEWEKDGEVIVRDAYGGSVAWLDADESSQLVEDGFLTWGDDESLLSHLIRTNKIERFIPGTSIEADTKFSESDDCSVREYEDAKAAFIDYAEKAIGKKVTRLYTDTVYGGGVAMYVETEDGRVYSGFFTQESDWKLQFGIHPDEEYYECLLLHELYEREGASELEWTDETRSQKGYKYLRDLEALEAEAKARKARELSFKEWMKEVDKLVIAKLGVSVHDLPDMNFRDMYEDEVDPETFVEEDVLPEMEAEFGYKFEPAPCKKPPCPDSVTKLAKAPRWVTLNNPEGGSDLVDSTTGEKFMVGQPSGAVDMVADQLNSGDIDPTTEAGEVAKSIADKLKR